ncbi:putative quinol monooxygenase [Chelatococcus asaccharovorans]|uniref:Quinol monooxygenase YgiN n=1 Tax=Chelatococcus asaccharovorans TaxID=28210 RepID=A0A2V3ULG8_9HYPH|nr:putative quinol monooxygenase [Chelatococcus asaccharovorans]MBS7706193.1 antibiotic biosynthesis monooxygenase [Chelatococcus asaccharovorans]PXW65174.1 quinol monooxygenase YgiN [Chelatococcus asaccharovorans]CAH1660261.1 Quinol monooxygenase YgiN [Chelatococcus asaccharovorans]CAH1683871.1 Quinol monooxygenase YgiN [Chelatococcus asaccharovorans]
MIVIHARFAVAPAAHAAFTSAMAQAATLARAEPGCVAYQFSVDLDDPGAFFLLELWESEAALEAHMQTPHLRDFLRLVRRVAAITSRVYEGPLRRYRIRIPEL